MSLFQVLPVTDPEGVIGEELEKYSISIIAIQSHNSS